jgi:FixJ family two-component response regulator
MAMICTPPSTPRTFFLSQIPVISIIDDDESVRAATNRLVRSLGLVALTFSGADEFLRSPRLHDTSCVIADVQMPGMSGIEMQSLLIARGNNIPIIFITAFPDEKIRARAMEAGAVGFLSKPFKGSALIEFIEAALNSQSGKG